MESPVYHRIFQYKRRKAMAKEKKLVEAITSMEEDFTQWYTDVVKKAELMDYSSVKGCMIFKIPTNTLYNTLLVVKSPLLNLAISM